MARLPVLEGGKRELDIERPKRGCQVVSQSPFLENGTLATVDEDNPNAIWGRPAQRPVSDGKLVATADQSDPQVRMHRV